MNIKSCRVCGSYAINEHLHGRIPGAKPDLCDVCYWREVALEARVSRTKGNNKNHIMTQKIKYQITGDWHPIYKAMRDTMIADGVSWKSLCEATSTAESTLQANFKGVGKPYFENVERVANSLGFHVALVPMSKEEIEDLENGTYINPGIVAAMEGTEAC